MKLILALGIFSAISTFSFAQSNTFPLSGNVGIGTLNPQFRLHLVGDHNNTNFGLQFDNIDLSKQANLTLWASEPGWTYTGAGIGNNVFNSSSGAGGIVRISNLKGGSYIRMLDQELRFNIINTNGTDINALYINPLGNIGIGTFNTDTRLAVVHTSGYGQVAKFSSKDQDEIVGIGVENNGFSWVGTTTNHNFQIYTHNSPKISVLANGEVGIGTTDPKGYKLAVAGNMIAESVKVKLQGAWPDYVFAKSYQLPTLKEMEVYIRESGHLPGIPTAADVKANGIDLGDMNAKMLQKIEELTLHLIEQDKNQKLLQKQVQILTNELFRSKSKK